MRSKPGTDSHLIQSGEQIQSRFATIALMGTSCLQYCFIACRVHPWRRPLLYFLPTEAWVVSSSMLKASQRGENFLADSKLKCVIPSVTVSYYLIIIHNQEQIQQPIFFWGPLGPPCHSEWHASSPEISLTHFFWEQHYSLESYVYREIFNALKHRV